MPVSIDRATYDLSFSKEYAGTTIRLVFVAPKKHDNGCNFGRISAMMSACNLGDHTSFKFTHARTPQASEVAWISKRVSTVPSIGVPCRQYVVSIGSWLQAGLVDLLPHRATRRFDPLLRPRRISYPALPLPPRPSRKTTSRHPIQRNVWSPGEGLFERQGAGEGRPGRAGEHCLPDTGGKGGISRRSLKQFKGWGDLGRVQIVRASIELTGSQEHIKSLAR